MPQQHSSIAQPRVVCDEAFEEAYPGTLQLLIDVRHIVWSWLPDTIASDWRLAKLASQQESNSYTMAYHRPLHVVVTHSGTLLI